VKTNDNYMLSSAKTNDDDVLTGICLVVRRLTMMICFNWIYNVV